MKKMYVMPLTEVIKINACELMRVPGVSGTDPREDLDPPIPIP